MNQPIRYIIAIRPRADIISEVKEMKLALKKAIGGFYNSVNSEAHITLFEFYALTSITRHCWKNVQGRPELWNHSSWNFRVFTTS
ncbi:hypothetical protein ACWKW6_17590 [Dyadobacter jiangsuensis]